MSLSILAHNMASEHNSYDHNESAGGKMNNNVIDVQSSAETLSSYASISQYEQGNSWPLITRDSCAV